MKMVDALKVTFVESVVEFKGYTDINVVRTIAFCAPAFVDNVVAGWFAVVFV
tara:strand:- start:1 stop:156 length:156 start_codon:yes stop_codon:yes gene_type:complete